MSVDRLDPRRVQCALIGMLFDPEYAARVLGDDPIDALSDRERALLRGVDPRGLRTDPYRRARAVAALIDEYPVTAAVLGVGAFERFFATEAFRAAVSDRGSMAVAFGIWIGERAHGVGRLEAAMATVRRPTRTSAPGLSCPSRIRALVVPAGTLAYHGRQRQRLGADPQRTLAGRAARTTERAPGRGTECLLVERRDDGSIDLGTGSEALVRLLAFAHTPRPRDMLEAEARRLGAEGDEAAEILDELLAQGLLTQG